MEMSIIFYFLDLSWSRWVNLMKIRIWSIAGKAAYLLESSNKTCINTNNIKLVAVMLLYTWLA